MKTRIVKFTKQECANLVNLECLGVSVFGKKFREQGACSILEDSPCLYFKICVLPLAEEKGYGDVIRQYGEIDKDSKPLKLKVRKCECGQDIPKGKQLCGDCRKKGRRKSHRLHNLKRQGLATTEV